MQTFREVREEDCYYVDKTPYIARLLDEGRHYFLSRPRRFGKSLLLDTLKELFEGNEELFTGLHIHDRGYWNWTARHPVVRLDFAGGSFKDPGYLQINLAAQLDAMEVATGVSPRYDTAPERFGYLIRSLHERSGQRVAVCWWTSTTSRSWTHGRRRRLPVPTATICAACTAVRE